jgi:TonB family protein
MMDWSSTLLSLLASVSLRALIVAAAAWLILLAGRTRLERARHAVWSIVVIAMLLAAPAALFLPAIPLRLLSAPTVTAPAAVSTGPVLEISSQPVPVEQRISWQQIAASLYCLGALAGLLRLTFAYRFTWQLVRRSRKVDFAGADIYESALTAVPVTTGWLRPKILLPETWREWDPGKIRAVLAHERAHVERSDWAMAAIAAVNRCLFWFHPLAWWLEHTLARLAEEACDDAALRQVECHEEYAQVLLDMAAAVKSNRGRVLRESLAMAKVAEVRMRIDRILDETRTIPMPLSRRTSVGLLACGLPLMCALSLLHLAPAKAMPNDVALEQAAPPQPAAEPQAPEQQSPPKAPPAAPSVKAKNAPSAAAPQLIRKVNAEYPAQAAAVDVKGTVRLSITIGKDGTVTDVTSATGHPLLINAAAAAVRQWIYQTQGSELHLQVDVPVMPGLSGTPATGEIFDLAPLTRVEPEFPALARQMGVHGTVEVVVTIGTDGHVTAVKVVKGHPLLVKATTDAVMRWTYRPPNSPIITRATLNFAPTATSPSMGQIQMATLISRREPEYPLEARQAGVSGLVELIATIGSDGTVKAVTVVKGDPLLIKAAQDAVMQWRYRPTMLNGVPVQADTHITLNFVAQK